MKHDDLIDPIPVWAERYPGGFNCWKIEHIFESDLGLAFHNGTLSEADNTMLRQAITRMWEEREVYTYAVELDTDLGASIKITSVVIVANDQRRDPPVARLIEFAQLVENQVADWWRELFAEAATPGTVAKPLGAVKESKIANVAPYEISRRVLDDKINRRRVLAHQRVRAFIIAVRETAGTDNVTNVIEVGQRLPTDGPWLSLADLRVLMGDLMVHSYRPGLLEESP